MPKNRVWLGIAILSAGLIGTVGVVTSVQAKAANKIKVAVNAALHNDHDSDWPLHEEETIRKSFTLTSGTRTLDVDNVTGFIEVVGSQSDQVQLVVNKTIRAESKERMDAAKKEVTLDITEQPDLVKLYVNGPFRCNCNCDCGGDDCSGWHGDRGYSVKMDFQLQVPRNIALKLKTVNSGHLNVRDVTGNFSVSNVNGGVELQNVGGGAAHAHTVNGPLKVVFRENPKENSDFGSVNGSIDLYFVRGLSADFRFKTLNGGVFTDFPMTSLPVQPASAETRNGKFVYRSDRYTGGRIGSGGMEVKVNTLNGNIRILEQK